MGENPGFATLYRISDFFSKYLRTSQEKPIKLRTSQKTLEKVIRGGEKRGKECIRRSIKRITMLIKVYKGL